MSKLLRLRQFEFGETEQEEPKQQQQNKTTETSRLLGTQRPQCSAVQCGAVRCSAVRWPTAGVQRLLTAYPYWALSELCVSRACGCHSTVAILYCRQCRASTERMTARASWHTFLVGACAAAESHASSCCIASSQLAQDGHECIQAEIRRRERVARQQCTRKAQPTAAPALAIPTALATERTSAPALPMTAAVSDAAIGARAGASASSAQQQQQRGELVQAATALRGYATTLLVL